MEIKYYDTPRHEDGMIIVGEAVISMDNTKKILEIICRSIEWAIRNGVYEQMSFADITIHFINYELNKHKIPYQLYADWISGEILVKDG